MSVTRTSQYLSALRLQRSRNDDSCALHTKGVRFSESVCMPAPIVSSGAKRIFPERRTSNSNSRYNQRPPECRRSRRNSTTPWYGSLHAKNDDVIQSLPNCSPVYIHLTPDAGEAGSMPRPASGQQPRYLKAPLAVPSGPLLCPR